MLAGIRRESRHLTGAPGKLLGIGSIHRQAHLAVVVEDDGIALLKAEWIDDRATVDAANTAFTRSFDTAGGPRRTAPRTFLIHERVVAKGGAVRHHGAGGGGQRKHAHRLDGD